MNIGIDLIKKASKNKILVQPNFYDLNFNADKNINKLNDENNNEKKSLLKNIDKEINEVNYLTKIVNEKLLFYKGDPNNNDINNKKVINIPYKDFFILNSNNDINNNNNGFIALKSENGIKLELSKAKSAKLQDQKKSDNNNDINQYTNEEYLNMPSLSNKLYITSNNNMPINLIKIDLKNFKNKKENEKDKEEINNINNYNTEKENENFLNYNNIDFNNINNYNNIINYNKGDINFSPFKNYNFDNKNRKDSLISDFSFYGNINLFNTDLNNLFNNGIL